MSAEIERLTELSAEQVEAKRSAIQAAIALVEGMSQHWMEERWKACNDLCDLALSALTERREPREAVLEGAAQGAQRGFRGMKASQFARDDGYNQGRWDAAIAIRALQASPSPSREAVRSSDTLLSLAEDIVLGKTGASWAMDHARDLASELLRLNRALKSPEPEPTNAAPTIIKYLPSGAGENFRKRHSRKLPTSLAPSRLRACEERLAK